jgi:hypothetical protein
MKFGKIFNFHKVHDKGITGRLEIHLYKDTLEVGGNNYTMLHSKNASGDMPAPDLEELEDPISPLMEKFIKLVELELSNPNPLAF